jgi:hypothetical protein
VLATLAVTVSVAIAYRAYRGVTTVSESPGISVSEKDRRELTKGAIPEVSPKLVPAEAVAAFDAGMQRALETATEATETGPEIQPWTREGLSLDYVDQPARQVVREIGQVRDDNGRGDRIELSPGLRPSSGARHIGELSRAKAAEHGPSGRASP